MHFVLKYDCRINCSQRKRQMDRFSRFWHYEQLLYPVAEERVWWVDPNQHLMPHPVTRSLFPRGMGETKGRAKARKKVGWDKESLISRKKKSKPKKLQVNRRQVKKLQSKKTFKCCKGHLLTTSHEQTDAQALWAMATLEPPPLVLSLSMTLYGMEYLFG